MKQLLTLIAVTASLSVMASTARMDVSNGKINLKPGKASKGCSISNPGWVKNEGQRKKRIHVSIGDLKDEWKEFEYTFTPDKDGTVLFSIAGQWYNAKKGQKPFYVYFKEVQVLEGSEIKNGDFSKKNKDGSLAVWKYNKKAKVKPVLEEKDGKTIVKLQYLCPMRQTISVKKGVPVKIKATVKKASPPAAK